MSQTVILRASQWEALSLEAARQALAQYLLPTSAKRVLLVPPDITRLPSMAGQLTAMAYELLAPTCGHIDVMPALGSHLPMTEEERRRMFGDGIPQSAYLVHRWREDVVRVGEVPAQTVRAISGGLMQDAIQVEVNRALVEGGYDVILALGQVVPHEVAGMSGYSKHILVGLGGPAIINHSHMLGAICGMEQAMGQDHAPVRQVLDYAQQHFLDALPLSYCLTVIGQRDGHNALVGLMLGRDRSAYEAAVEAVQQENITLLDQPAERVVCYMDPEEFRSTWLANKAIYRTRMAIADGGELIVLAPGIRMFGEDDALNGLIERYGYRGAEAVLNNVREHEDLAGNLSVAAHLIHGSSEGRFTIRYCAPGLGRQRVEGVGFAYGDLEEWLACCPPERMAEGWNTLTDGSTVYFIHNPALGLWSTRDRFDRQG